MASDVVGPPLVKHELQLEADVKRNRWRLRQENTDLGVRRRSIENGPWEQTLRTRSTYFRLVSAAQAVNFFPVCASPLCSGDRAVSSVSTPGTQRTQSMEFWW